MDILTCNKQGRQSVIVDMIGYDKEGHTVYTKLGNGTETTYTYDKQRERLQVMNLTADGQTVMENRYQYDAVDNILGITNAANPTSLTKLNRAKLGGKSSHTYEYDELNRLVHANGKAKSASYDMVMSFGRMSEPLTKVQKVDSTTTAKSYNFAYKYEDSNHPTAPTQIGNDHYTYDANGNPTLVTNDSTNTTREMYWDEDNRLMVLSDNGKTSRYTYNAAGERIMKSYGTMEGVYINGAPQGITFHETDNFTLYPASIISINKNRFTKHYFIGDKRIASRIGTGLFNNVYGRNGSYVTAGQQDYAERMNQIQKQKEAYYKQQGIAPGVPTEKGAYGDPENTGVGYNAVLTELGTHDVPQGWIQTPRPNTTPNTNPGPPVSWNDPSNPDDPQAGYGYIPNDTTKEETFFYHSDHLGSTSYITDDKANITQYDAYLPYGELLVDEHSSSEELPYKFNGKEFDEETGLYYYGARYMNPVTSLWYGVDPLAEKYKSIGAYVYCSANPIRLIDSDGKKILFVNGYWNGSIGSIIGSSSAGEKYWGRGFADAARSFFKDYSQINSSNYIDGSSMWGGDMSGGDRYVAGYKFAKDNIQKLTSGMRKGESFNMVTHSEGSAYGAGVAQYLLDAGYKVTTILHLSSDEGDEFSTPKAPYTLQLSYEGDWVTGNKTIKNVDKVGEIKKGNLTWKTVHGTTKDKGIFSAAEDLEKVTLQNNIGEINGKVSSWYNQENTKRTNFYSVNGIILSNPDGTKKR